MRKTTLMIVDSQPFFRAGVVQALSQDSHSESMQVIECDPGDDGSGAINQIAAKSPDIVLLDIGYPFLSGLELGKKIARTFPRRRRRVVRSHQDRSGGLPPQQAQHPIRARQHDKACLQR